MFKSIKIALKLKSKTMQTRLFGMITTASSARYTVEALKTFFFHTEINAVDRFILIDNDGAWQKENLFSHAALELKVNQQQLGFAENANYLIKQALEMQADLILLNNDLVFTTDWLSPLEKSDTCISSPLSNREVQYALSVQVAKTNFQSKIVLSSTEMDFEQYQPDRFAIQAIAEAHRAANNQGHLPVIVLPFFCARMPLVILKEVGLFDEDFGKGGAEDYDYALRARLAGFEIVYSLGSWILHFYGKSSWSGVENTEQRTSRESKMVSHFEKKWGKFLKQLVFEENQKIISELGIRIPSNVEEYIELIKTLREKGLAES